MATVAAAQETPRISNVLEDVAAQAGVNIIADPSVGGVVSAELQDVTVDRAMELLLAGTGFQYMTADGYYLVFSPDASAAMFPSVAETEIARVRHVPAETARGMLPEPLQRYVRGTRQRTGEH